MQKQSKIRLSKSAGRLTLVSHVYLYHYFEHHVHVKDCKCPAPNQDTPQTVAATSVQEALDKINTTLFCGSTTSQYVAPCVEGGAR